jgi:hypothetical protein
MDLVFTGKAYKKKLLFVSCGTRLPEHQVYGKH